MLLFAMLKDYTSIKKFKMQSNFYIIQYIEINFTAV